MAPQPKSCEANTIKIVSKIAFLLLTLFLEEPVHEGEDAALPEGVAPVHQLVGPALDTIGINSQKV